MNKHIIIYSHGFGVTKDDRGLFTDIARALPEAEHVMFDYNTIDEDNNTLTVRPFSEQAEMLQSVVVAQKKQHPHATIDLICHSQGCRIAAIAQCPGIAHTIFLAPPVDGGAERTIQRYINNPDSHIDLEGTSRLARSDGSTTIIPAAYWAERMHEASPIPAFNALGRTTKLTIVKALQDHVTGDTNLSEIEAHVTVLDVEGDHDFSTTRDLLCKNISDILQM